MRAELLTATPSTSLEWTAAVTAGKTLLSAALATYSPPGHEEFDALPHLKTVYAALSSLGACMQPVCMYLSLSKIAK